MPKPTLVNRLNQMAITNHRNLLSLLLLFFIYGVTAQDIKQPYSLDTINLPTEVIQNYPLSVNKIITSLEKETGTEKQLILYDSLLTELTLLELKGIIYYSNKMLGLARRNDNKKAIVESYVFKGVGYIGLSGFKKGEHFLKMAEKVSEEIDYSTGLGKAKSRLAFCFHIQGNHMEGSEIGKDAIKIFQELGLKDDLAAAMMNTGNCYKGLGQFEKALEFLIGARKLFYSLNNINRKITIDYNFAAYYFGLAKLKETKKHAMECLDLIKPQTHLVRSGGVKNILGAVALQEGKMKDAIKWFTASATDYGRTDKKAELATVYTNLGTTYLYSGNPQRCLQANKKALEIGAYLKSSAVLIPAYSSVGAAYLELENWDKAVFYQQECLKLCEANENKHYISSILEGLAETYFKKGDFKKGYEYYQQFHEKDKEVFNSKTQKKIEELREGYEAEKREADIAKGIALNELQAAQLFGNRIGLLSMILVAIIMAYFLFSIKKKNNLISGINGKLKQSNEALEISKNHALMLLQEVQHRVKNNLNFVSSLLDLQSIYTKNKAAQEIVSEGRNRVDTMGLLHQKLTYKEELPVDINMKEYLNELILNLQEAMSVGHSDRLIVKLEAVKLDIDKATPVGLIVNELICNSFKHRRNIEVPLELKISLSNREKINLIVEDNGQGLPDGFKIDNTSSFGLRLVEMLRRQLKGQLHISNTPGAKFELEFEK